MYLHCHAPDKDADKTRNTILFYALCVLYVLSLATIVGDISTFVIVEVSNDSVTVTIFALIACADLRVTWHCRVLHFRRNKRLLWLHLSVYPSMHKPCFSFFLFIQVFKDLSLLDCVESQYPRRDHSFNLSILILRSVCQLSSLTSLFQLIASSYLAIG